MSICKLSLAAMLSMGTMLCAADTLADAFKDGSLKGELRAYYFERDNDAKALDKNGIEILDFATKLQYETASFYGFKIGTTFQGVSSPFVDEDAKKSSFKNDMYGPGAVLSEAYIAYTLQNTTVKVGRQFVDVLLSKSTGSRAIMESFEGLTIVNKDIPKTTLSFVYFTKYQNHTDGAGSIGEFAKLAGDYGYSFAIENKSIENLTLSAAYADLDTVASIAYAEGIYKSKINDYDYLLGVQYSETDYDKSTTKDATYYGAKAGIGFGGFNTYAAYTEVQDGAAKWQLMGTGNKPLLFTTTITGSGQYEESKQYAIDANYKIKPLDVTIGARIVNVDYAGTEKADFPSVYASYDCVGALKNLSLSIQYEEKNSNMANKDWSELRFRSIYKF